MLVEAERRRILSEYMAQEDDIRHLPKGVIQEQDLQLLPESVQAEYTRRLNESDDDLAFGS